MDFRSLTRRELQALCKKNKIHANMTNVAMADALQDLHLVEGIEDFLKPSETAMSSTRTRNSTRRKLAGNVDDEVVQTPVGRREKQDVPKTPGVVLTSQKREAKEKRSVSQVYTIRRSARLAAKRLKESGKQDNQRLDQTIKFDDFSEAVPKGLEVNTGRCSLHFDDEVGKAAADEGSGSNKPKEGATDLSPLSFEFENLNLSNKELKVDMPECSEELATSDNNNAIIENNVEMLLSNNKLGEGEELNDDKAKELDSSLDVEPANFVLDENSSDNGKESHCDERLNEPDEEPNNEQISVGEVEEDADLQCKGQEVVGKDDNIKNISGCEVQGADVQCNGQQIVGNDNIEDNEDDPNIEENDLQYKVEEVVGKDDNIEHSSECEVEGEETTDDENEMSYKALCYSEDEDASEAITGDENSDAELPTEAGSESLDSELSFDEFIGDAIDANSKSLDGEGSLEKLAGDDEKEPNNEGLSEDENDGIDSNCESLDGEGSLEKLASDEKEPNNEGLSEDEDGIDSNCESLDGEGTLGGKLTGDEKEAKNEGLSYNMDAIEDKKPVQEYVKNSAGKEPFVFLESSVTQVGPIGGTPLSAVAFDHKQIPTGSEETNLGDTIKMISSTPVKKKSSIKTPKKTPILSAGVKSVSDDKENVDNSGRKLVRIKKNKEKHHEDCSPREITKSNASTTKEATRPALHQLQENCLVDSSGNAVEV